MTRVTLPDPIKFEWDEGNQTKSFVKHGITKSEAEETFLRFKLIQPYQRHSKTEARYGMYGQTDSGKILYIAFTIRKQAIRIISARLVDKGERKIYEEAFKKTT